MKLNKISLAVIACLGFSSAALSSDNIEVPQPPHDDTPVVSGCNPFFCKEEIIKPGTPPTQAEVNGQPVYDADGNPIMNPPTPPSVEYTPKYEGVSIDGKFEGDTFQSAGDLAVTAIKSADEANTKLDGAIADGKTALAETNEKVTANSDAITANTDTIKETNTKLDGAIADGKTALAETNEKVTANSDAITANTDTIKETNTKLDGAIADGKTALAETNEKVTANSDAITENTGAIKETNTKLDGAIADGKTALAETNEKVTANAGAIKDTNTKLDNTITNGKIALAETNEKVTANTVAIKDTNTKLDNSISQQKEINGQVNGKLAQNDAFWEEQWKQNYSYDASIKQNKSDIAKNRQDINKLNSRVDRLDQKVDDLNDTMKRGFASQAALNGLFQPYGVGKLNATMALGGYESKTAIAAGTGYRFDENTAVKAGIATNTNDFKGVTYNVGVNFEW
ncbi:YadA-like family protein [Providencia stuartii]|uniref:YadA-like family protein n=3 Tax=Providencia stuartii TaxID=588 RepID=UPI00300DB705